MSADIAHLDAPSYVIIRKGRSCKAGVGAIIPKQTIAFASNDSVRWLNILQNKERNFSKQISSFVLQNMPFRPKKGLSDVEYFWLGVNASVVVHSIAICVLFKPITATLVLFLISASVPVDFLYLERARPFQDALIFPQ